jgi:hypothetical protein
MRQGFVTQGIEALEYALSIWPEEESEPEGSGLELAFVGQTLPEEELPEIRVEACGEVMTIDGSSQWLVTEQAHAEIKELADSITGDRPRVLTSVAVDEMRRLLQELKERGLIWRKP